MNTSNISYELSCMSFYSNTIEKGILIDNQIISNTFHIPYSHCQGVYCDNDVCFIVKLFHNEIKISECEIQFELFDDNEQIPKKIKWKSTYIDDKYIINYFENIECQDSYIFDEKLFITFNIDSRINGYMYEQIYGIGSYDWKQENIIDLFTGLNIKDDNL